jgi:hypothetical protein
MVGEFTITDLLKAIRKTYPKTKRTSMHAIMANIEKGGEIEVVHRGRIGDTMNPTIYRQASTEARA